MMAAAARKNRAMPFRPHVDVLGLHPDDSVGVKVVGKMVHKNPKTISNRLAEGTFCKPYKRGAGGNAWWVRDVWAWMLANGYDLSAFKHYEGRLG